MSMSASVAARVSASTGIRVMATTPRRERKREDKSFMFQQWKTPQGTFSP